jgi:hypothetical protein
MSFEIAEGPMAGRKTREVLVYASVEDAYDGTVRLLADAQRFGLGLGAMSLESNEEGGSVLTLTLKVPEHVDDRLLASRFARHPGVSRVALGSRAIDPEWEELEPLAA